MPYKYSHWGRLSLLRFDELQVHFDVIFIRSVRRVRSDEDHVCFNFTNVQSVCTRTHFVIALFVTHLNGPDNDATSNIIQS